MATSSKGSKSTAGSKGTAVAKAPVAWEDVEEHIIDVDVTSEMEASFLEYAYSVIYSRALPDARDGLKPVQRRILYMMRQMGLAPNKGHVKSARVTGEVMGKLHPHGDAAIYDAMVRMAQSFSLRLPLVDGHGNFGSLDDGPAAARYTEARLADSAIDMTDDLDEDVVDFVPNYDSRLLQPEVLPAAFPNLLVNGSSGIAVGMATNIAPHNPGEVITGARHLIENPDASLKDIMKFIPGPDLPSGGTIVGLDGVKQAYETGRGVFRTRAKVELEKVTARKQALVVTELPYGVGPEKVIEKIKDAADAKKLTGVSDVVDLTDRHHGLRLVIELKTGFNPNAVLAALYKHTPMEDSFGINNVALVDGRPQQLGLLEMLQVYVDHRLDVVRRRTQFRHGKRKDRLHLVEGLLIAILDIDEVIRIVRDSEDTATARAALRERFSLSEPQADHILELRLRQLTKFSQVELEAEKKNLEEEIAYLEGILGSDAKLRELVSSELAEVAERHHSPRRTVLMAKPKDVPLAGTVMPESDAGAGSAKKPMSMQVADTECFVVLSATGKLVRTHGRDEVLGERRSRHDVIASIVPTTARGHIGLLTNTGRMARISVVEIPQVLPGSNGVPLGDGVAATEFMPVERRERIIAAVPLDEVFAVGTAQGVVKRVNPDYPVTTDEWPAITLKAGDEVIGAATCPDSAELVFVSREAQLLRFGADKVRPQGRTGGGVAGIKLGAKDSVVFSGVVLNEADAVAVTIADGPEPLPGAEGGSAKVTPLAEFPAKGRGTMGVRAHRFLKGEDHLVSAWVGAGPARGASKGGMARALPLEYGRRDGSGVPLTQAVEIMGPAGSVAALKPADDAVAAGAETPAGTAAADAVEAETATAAKTAASKQAAPKQPAKPASQRATPSQRRAPVQPEMDSLPFDDDAVSIEPGNRVDLRGNDKK